MLAKHLGMLDGDSNVTNNIQFVFVGTKGKTLEESIKMHGVVEIAQDD